MSVHRIILTAAIILLTGPALSQETRGPFNVLRDFSTLTEDQKQSGLIIDSLTTDGARARLAAEGILSEADIAGKLALQDPANAVRNLRTIFTNANPPIFTASAGAVLSGNNAIRELATRTFDASAFGRDTQIGKDFGAWANIPPGGLLNGSNSVSFGRDGSLGWNPKNLQSANSNSVFLPFPTRSDVAAADLADQISRLKILTGKPIDVDELPTFSRNVTATLGEDAAKPGVLRQWNGVRASRPDVYPDTVMVLGGGKLCTGVLVAPDKVLTAAHCYCDLVREKVVVGLSSIDLRTLVEVDLPNSRSMIDCTALQSPAPEGSMGALRGGDVALLALKGSLNDVPTRRIASEDSFRQARQVRTVGFGKTAQDGIGVKYLTDITIASYDCTEAEVQTGGIYGCSPGLEMIAAGMNRDTCGGDSGGPAYVLGADINLYIAALTSRAVSPDGTCGNGGIYVKLNTTSVKSWLISQGINDDLFQK